MKRTTSLLLALLPLLCACGGGDDVRAFSTLYREAQGITATATVNTLIGDVAMSFTFEYRKAGEEAIVAIQAPEALRGINAKLLEGADGAVFIDYQGASVETLLPGIPGFSPADALHGVIDDLALSLPEAESADAWGGIDCLRLTFGSEADGVRLMKQVWLNRENGAVCHAQFFVDEQLCMSLEVTALTLF